MKLAKEQLKQIIREEMGKIVSTNSLYLAEMFDTSSQDPRIKEKCLGPPEAPTGNTWMAGGCYDRDGKPIEIAAKLGEDLSEVTAGEEVDWLKMLGDELLQISDKPLPKDMEKRIVDAYDLKDLHDKIKDLKEPEYKSETDKGWSTKRLTSPDVPDSRGPGAEDPAGVSKKSHVSKVPRRAAPRQNTTLAGVNELKLTKQQLKEIIKEELEVILTDEEAREMFGLENIQEVTAEEEIIKDGN